MTLQLRLLTQFSALILLVTWQCTKPETLSRDTMAMTLQAVFAYQSVLADDLSSPTLFTEAVQRCATASQMALNISQTCLLLQAVFAQPVHLGG